MKHTINFSPLKTSALFLALIIFFVVGANDALGQAKRGKTASSARNTGGSGIVSIETGVVNRGGDVKTAARTEFLLLNRSLEDILKDSDIKLIDNSMSYTQNLALSYFGSRKYGITDDNIQKSIDATAPYIKAKVTTDFNGKATFSPVKAGTYYIMGVGKFAQNIVIWNAPVTVKSGRNVVILDQENGVVF